MALATCKPQLKGNIVNKIMAFNTDRSKMLLSPTLYHVTERGCHKAKAGGGLFSIISLPFLFFSSEPEIKVT